MSQKGTQSEAVENKPLGENPLTPSREAVEGALLASTAWATAILLTTLL